MRLNETEMVKLLPAWMQEDGSDKGLATGCDIISRDAYARLKLLSRWDKIDQLNDAELDEMAWELNIQWYDSTAPIAPMPPASVTARDSATGHAPAIGDNSTGRCSPKRAQNASLR